MNKILSLGEESHQRERADGDENLVSRLVVWYVPRPVYLAANQGAYLHDDILDPRHSFSNGSTVISKMMLAGEKAYICCGCDSALLHAEAIFGYPGRDNGVEVRVTRNESDQGKAFPIPATVRNREEGGEKRDQPELSKEAVEGSLVEILAAIRECQHRDDLDAGRRRGQHV